MSILYRYLKFLLVIFEYRLGKKTNNSFGKRKRANDKIKGQNLVSLRWKNSAKLCVNWRDKVRSKDNIVCVRIYIWSFVENAAKTSAHATTNTAQCLHRRRHTVLIYSSRLLCSAHQLDHFQFKDVTFEFDILILIDYTKREL